MYAHCKYVLCEREKNNQFLAVDNLFLALSANCPPVCAVSAFLGLRKHENALDRRWGKCSKGHVGSFPHAVVLVLADVSRQLRQSSIKQKGKNIQMVQIERKSSGSPGLDTRNKDEFLQEIYSHGLTKKYRHPTSTLLSS